MPIFLGGAISITTDKYGDWGYVNYPKTQKYNDWCVYAVMTMRQSLYAQCDYADHFREFRHEVVTPITSCCISINHSLCGGVPVDLLIPFWTKEFSENYWTGWNNIMNIFDSKNNSYRKDLPRLGVLDLRSTGATYHAVLIYYVEVTTSSTGVKEYWVYYLDPWIGSSRGVRNPLEFYALCGK